MKRRGSSRLAGGWWSAAARGTDLWLDGGHNPHAARAIAQALAALQARDGRPSALIVGMLANKDAEGFFAPFAPLGSRVLTVGFEAGRSAGAVALARAASSHGLDAQPCADLDEALALALGAEGAAPRVVIAGSLYLAGEVLARSPETWPS